MTDPTTLADAPPPPDPLSRIADEPGPGLPAKRKRRIGTTVAIVLLSLAVVAASAVAILGLIRLDEAQTVIEDQSDEIDEQRDLIDEKKVFEAAMQNLVDTASQYDGTLFASVVPSSHIATLATRGWTHRWTATALETDIADVRSAQADLASALTRAQAEVATNATGTTYEAVIDRLGGGWVATAIDDADSLCGSDVLGCVASDDPLVVHIDDGNVELPYLNDWLQTGLAYHEFAHTLQMTNPEPTRVAAEAFGGDEEIMADCFALTYLDGWTLDHRVWTSSYEYWDASVGYCYTCDAAQRDVVRTWYGQLGYRSSAVTQ